MPRSYILARIDRGGYIRCSDNIPKIVHKQTVNLDRDDSLRCFARLDMAKSAWEGSEDPEIILGLNDEGAAESIYCKAAQEPTVKDRLKIWAGCYGAWPVRRLSE
jgi:hypothetical protein